MNDKINTSEFCDALINDYKFFAGVPDTVLKDLCSALSERLSTKQFLTTANEGNAVALCAGYTLATGNIGAVYMQNSGFGNAVNPLLSLNDSLVYQIPVLLIIGWRGEENVQDEPQHKKQGLITRGLLDICGIPYRILKKDTIDAITDLSWATDELYKRQSPVALLVRKNTFAESCAPIKNKYELIRETAIEAILDTLKGQDYKIVSTTGMVSRELYELREKRGEAHINDFLSIGAMGHTSSIAFGIALSNPMEKIICLDGDGAVLMHLGALAIIGTSSIENIIHIVLNNVAHDSVGGHPTCADKVDLTQIALACGYTQSICVYNAYGLVQAVGTALSCGSRVFIEVKVAKREDSNVGRPNISAINMKREFMRLIN